MCPLTDPQTFGATAFSSYGGFWFSFAALYIPQFGIAGEYPYNLSNTLVYFPLLAPTCPIAPARGPSQCSI